MEELHPVKWRYHRWNYSYDCVWIIWLLPELFCHESTCCSARFNLSGEIKVCDFGISRVAFGQEPETAAIFALRSGEVNEWQWILDHFQLHDTQMLLFWLGNILGVFITADLWLNWTPGWWPGLCFCQGLSICSVSEVYYLFNFCMFVWFCVWTYVLIPLQHKTGPLLSVLLTWLLRWLAGKEDDGFFKDVPGVVTHEFHQASKSPQKTCHWAGTRASKHDRVFAISFGHPVACFFFCEARVAPSESAWGAIELLLGATRMQLSPLQTVYLEYIYISFQS